VLTVRRIEFKDFDVWIRKHLRKSDVVTLEATLNAWHLYDKLVPLVATVMVTNPKSGPRARATRRRAARRTKSNRGSRAVRAAGGARADVEPPATAPNRSRPYP
jgi:hypothetical protein